MYGYQREIPSRNTQYRLADRTTEGHSAMIEDELTSILVTNEHLVYAKTTLRGRRFLDVLSDVNTDFLCVRDAQVFQRRGDACIAALPKAVIRKASIALAIPASDKHETPQKRRDSFVSKKRYDAFLIVLGYEVRGELALKGTDDPVSVLSHELGGFFPIPRGMVSFAGARCEQQKAQVVIVNKDFVSLFQLEKLTTGGASVRERLRTDAQIDSHDDNDLSQLKC